MDAIVYEGVGNIFELLLVYILLPLAIIFTLRNIFRTIWNVSIGFLSKYSKKFYLARSQDKFFLQWMDICVVIIMIIAISKGLINLNLFNGLSTTLIILVVFGIVLISFTLNDISKHYLKESEFQTIVEIWCDYEILFNENNYKFKEVALSLLNGNKISIIQLNELLKNKSSFFTDDEKERFISFGDADIMNKLWYDSRKIFIREFVKLVRIKLKDNIDM